MASQFRFGQSPVSFGFGYSSRGSPTPSLTSSSVATSTPLSTGSFNRPWASEPSTLTPYTTKPASTKDTEAESIRKVTDDFEKDIRRSLEFTPITPLKLHMTREIADVLCERFAEDHRFRLEYMPDGFLMVTYPSDVHESFVSIVHCFKDIVAANESFVVGTGIEILVKDKFGASKKHIPDLAFGRKSTGPTTDPEYGIVVECGYSQSFPDLMDKLGCYFSVPTTQCVTIVKFHCGDLRMPGAETPIPAEPLSRDAFPPNRPTGFGPIEADGFTWAPEITKITMAVYIRDDEGNNAGQSIGEDFDITPGSFDLQDSQMQIVNMLYTGILKFVGAEILDTIYPSPDDFTIQWDNFYKDLKGHLVSDAYKRYLLWVGKKPQPSYVPPKVITKPPNLRERLKSMQDEARLRKRPRTSKDA
ncbi:hypothetical protein DFH06DRAFT_1175053 [Mycena polygramma]|nr:hypothetical protein DFH06DRAFT_1175053 [Mycena polygramma]